MIPPIRYEPHFFDIWINYLTSKSPDEYNKTDIDKIRFEYLNHAFNMTEINATNYTLYSFEKTPKYIFDPYVPARIKTVLPWTKIIMLLRDPVDRAYSMFKMNIEDYYGEVNFEMCVDIDVKKLQKAGIFHDTFWAVDDQERERRWLEYWKIWDQGHLTRKGICNGDLGRGLYYMQLQSWFKQYNDDEARKQILVVKSESLIPDNITKSINLKVLTDFIGVEEMNVIEEERIHATNSSLGPMKKETKRKMRQLFDPFNKKLFLLLGQDWENPWPYDDEDL